MSYRKIKIFLQLHWIKLAVIASIIFAILLPVVVLSFIDSYQRIYLLAWLAITPLSSIISGGIFVFMLYYLHYGGGFAKFQKSRIKGENVNIAWSDVIGMEDAKMEAWEVVQLIRDRTKLQKIGGKVIRGILMVGPPGCGKTYLAKAIATEANVPFLSMSGSEFVEIFVGVGASRVRKLFKQARQLAYANGACIVFIDEIDAVGRKRVFSVFGGTEETNSTQNQLLAEMDGLKEKQENVIVIAATNASETTLDEALLRPGRFDRKIYIDLPNLEEREKLFGYYLKKIKYEPQIDVGRLARKCVYKTPADIENIVKESALIATRYKKDIVTWKEIVDAIERVDLGIKHKRKMSEREKQMVAYHEAGHLIVTYILHPTDDVFKASIISRRDTLGVVYHQPREELFTSNRDRILANIKVSLGGYVAEKLKCGVTSDGVAMDFKQAMKQAHDMVWKYGMGTNGFLGDYTIIPESQLSEEIKQKLNNETHVIVQQCAKEVEELLAKESAILDRFATELLEKDELDYDEIDAIFNEYGKNHHSKCASV